MSEGANLAGLLPGFDSPCDGEDVPIHVSGGGGQDQTTKRFASALLGRPDWSVPNRQVPPHSRSWLRNHPACEARSLGPGGPVRRRSAGLRAPDVWSEAWWPLLVVGPGEVVAVDIASVDEETTSW
jgi:hypothetical protein